MEFKYVFGPVRSGRLGLSLGLDLLDAPICSLDCLYCEVGRTSALTCKRKPYVPAEKILEELSAYKEAGRPTPEYMTLGGMGEPCLNSDMPAIIRGAKKIYPGVPVAVLTNSTLLTDETVRAELAEADVVLPSLDSLVEEEFRKINRPAEGLTAEKIAEALAEFRRMFTGKLYLEILLVKGINDSEENLARLAEYVTRIRPDRIDVVTMTRPGAYGEARPVDADTLARWRKELRAETAAAKAETAHCGSTSELPDSELQETIFSSIRRRPQTATQLAAALNAPEERVRRALAELASAGRVDVRDDYYAPAGFYTD